MKELTAGQWQSFTARYSSLVQMLTTPVRVGASFDPKQAPSVDGSLDLTAIWDTGATGTVVTRAIAERLGLKPIRLAKGSTVGGEFESNVYLVSLFLPNMVCIPQVEAFEGEIEGADVLIGMDIIGSGDFAVTNFDDKTTLTFRVPSRECIDFGEAEESPAGQSGRKVGRNEPCPCGSGKKYKRCCGQK